MAYLTISGNQLSTFTAYNEYIADVIVAVIVYLSAFTLFFKGLMDKRSSGRISPQSAGKAAGKEEK